MDGFPTAFVVSIALLALGYYFLQASGAADPGGIIGATTSGNKFIDALAGAIAHAEGYYIPGSRPWRNNNPGDISDPSFGGVTRIAVDSGGLSVFATAQDGWTALYAKLQNALNGGSNVYSPAGTISDWAWSWTATNPDDWANNVASNLTSAGYSATPDTSIQAVQLA
jgi:hypothetical protein